MGGQIYGSGITTIDFRDDLHWVSEGENEEIMSEKTALDGTRVQSWLTAQSGQVDSEHKFKFTWEPRSTIQTLATIKEAKSSFYLKTSASATALLCRFAKSSPLTKSLVAKSDFLSPDAAEGNPTDLYSGELHLLVRQ